MENKRKQVIKKRQLYPVWAKFEAPHRVWPLNQTVSACSADTRNQRQNNLIIFGCGTMIPSDIWKKTK